MERSFEVLSDLCAICHSDPIKYTCPGCGIHTCSVPCVKRHKSQAQCSGIRNPAAYRNRADLATPASLDQDFNFITKVERSVGRGQTDLQEKGVHYAVSITDTASKRTKFEVEVALAGVQLIKAPRGLSRSRTNKSHWAGSNKGLTWTVEWRLEDHDVRTANLKDSSTLADGFLTLFGKKPLQRKRRWSGNEVQQIAKRLRSEVSQAKPVNGELAPSAEVVGENIPQQQTSDTAVDAADDEGKEHLVDRLQRHALPQHCLDHPKDLKAEDVEPVAATTTDNSKPDEGSREATHNQNVNHSSEPPHPSTDLHVDTSKKPGMGEIFDGWFFYLHKPNTLARHTCLIAVSSDDTLRTILKDRTVLEYPTIYVRTDAPSDLPKPFIIEDEYLAQHQDSEQPIEVKLSTGESSPKISVI